MVGTIQDIHQSQRVFRSSGAHLPSQHSGGTEGVQGELGLHETLPKYTPPNQNQTPKETLEEGPFCEGWKGLPVWPKDAEFNRHNCRLAVPEEGCILFQIFQPRPDCNRNLTLWVISKYLWSQGRGSHGVPEAADQLPSTWKSPLWLRHLQGVRGL